MWNPGLDRTNRKARRRALKWDTGNEKGAKFDWQAYKHLYGPRFQPIDLGIKRFKRQNEGNNTLIKTFKQEAWAYHDSIKPDGVK